MTVNAEQRAFINEQLRVGQFVEFFHEHGTQAAAGGMWRLRDQLHADEAAREQRILEALPKTDNRLVVALDASTRRFSALQLLDPLPALDFHGGTTGAADPKIAAEHSAAENARRTHLANNWVNRAIEEITVGKIKHFEDLQSATPKDVNFDAAKAMLAQAGKPRIELRSRQGVVQLGGHDLEVKKLPYRTTHRVRVDVREIDEDGKPNGTVQFKVDLKQLTDLRAPDVLRTSDKLKASLETAADARSLAVLHFAKFCQAPVELELALSYLLAERRTELTITQIVNQAEILSSTRTPSELINELF